MRPGRRSNARWATRGGRAPRTSRPRSSAVWRRLCSSAPRPVPEAIERCEGLLGEARGDPGAEPTVLVTLGGPRGDGGRAGRGSSAVRARAGDSRGARPSPAPRLDHVRRREHRASRGRSCRRRAQSAPRARDAGGDGRERRPADTGGRAGGGAVRAGRARGGRTADRAERADRRVRGQRIAGDVATDPRRVSAEGETGRRRSYSPPRRSSSPGARTASTCRHAPSIAGRTCSPTAAPRGSGEGVS